MDTAFDERSHLPITFAELKATDEGSVAEFLTQVSFGVGVGATSTLLGGVGGFTVGASAFVGDTMRSLVSLNEDEQMLTASLNSLGGAHEAASGIFKQTMEAMDVDRADQAAGPEGRIVSVENIRAFERTLYGYGWKINKRAAESQVTVENTGDSTARFWLEGTFKQTFTTTRLLPEISGLEQIGGRLYDIDRAFVSEPIELAPGEQRTIDLTYAGLETGEEPPGEIRMRLRAFDDGREAFADATTTEFNTTYLNVETGETVSEDELGDDQVVTYPVQSRIIPTEDPSVDRLWVELDNPFDVTTPFQFEQALPENVEVVDAGQGRVVNDTLVVEGELQPGEGLPLGFELKLLPTDTATVLPAGNLSAFDTVNALWRDFDAPSHELALPGDVNSDGVVDGLDIDPFVQLLTGGAPYEVAADLDANGVVDGLDIDPFVQLLTGASQGDPAGGTSEDVQTNVLGPATVPQDELTPATPQRDGVADVTIEHEVDISDPLVARQSDLTDFPVSPMWSAPEMRESRLASAWPAEGDEEEIVDLLTWTTHRSTG